MSFQQRQCNTCKWWAQQPERGSRDTRHRRCTAAYKFSPFLFHAYAEPDGQGWRTGAYLEANEEFGCIHWEEHDD